MNERSDRRDQDCFLVEAVELFADHAWRSSGPDDNAKAYTESVLSAETAAGLGIRLKSSSGTGDQQQR